MKKVLFFCISLAVPAILQIGERASAATQNIAIENMKFIPEAVTIHPGDSVVWTNKDIVSHTVTDEKSSFNSDEIKPGSRWRKQFRAPGNYSYKCSYHPVMKAALTVSK